MEKREDAIAARNSKRGISINLAIAGGYLETVKLLLEDAHI